MKKEPFLLLVVADIERLEWCLSSGVPVPDAGYASMFREHSLAVAVSNAYKEHGRDVPDEFWVQVVAGYGANHFCAAYAAFAEARDSGRWDVLRRSGELIEKTGRAIDDGLGQNPGLLFDWAAMERAAMSIVSEFESILDGERVV